MFKLTLFLVLIVYICSDGMVNKSTYDNLRRTATYKIKDWNTNPFRKISKEQFYQEYASKDIPHIPKVKYGQTVSSSKNDLPEYYDARDVYQSCVPVIKAQGQCGASPAFSGAGALAFRFCMVTGEYVELSPQDQIACKHPNCKLGDLVSSWEYYEEEGLVSEKCFPFVSGNKTEFPECPNTNQKCVVDKEGKQEKFVKYKAKKGSSMAFESVDDIKIEIMTHGPIQAGIFLYESLLHYESGIYKADSGTLLGWHALTLLGWGVEDGVEYWIGQNSWGKNWGEEGYIRMSLHSAGIDKYGYAGYPDVDLLEYPF